MKEGYLGCMHYYPFFCWRSKDKVLGRGCFALSAIKSKAGLCYGLHAYSILTCYQINLSWLVHAGRFKSKYFSFGLWSLVPLANYLISFLYWKHFYYFLVSSLLGREWIICPICVWVFKWVLKLTCFITSLLYKST